MLSSPLRRLVPVILLGLAQPVLAHDDDPKVLSLEKPYQGPGFQSAAALGSGAGTTTLPGITFGSSGVQLLSWLPLNMLGGGSAGNDCWGYVSGSGREYAIIGTSENTVFVEVTNPGNPQLIAAIAGPTSTWRDTKIYQDHAYSVSEAGSGIQVMDLSQIDNGTVTLVGSVNDVGTSATHNVAIDEVSGFLYRSGGSSNGLRMYSLANPAVPTFVGQWNAKYVHDVQVVTYTTGPQAGKQLAYCCGGFNGGYDQTGLTILDVTNKANPQIMDEVFYSNPAYSHQGWLSEDRNYFYLGDELDENGVLPTTTHVIDVSDPTNAFFVGPFTNGNQAIGHNLYTKGDLIYEANYTSGLRVFDSSVSQTAPVEVAMFDTYPDHDQDTFNGLWSCYPYLPSGIVLGSDREKGLFVWWVGDPLVTFAFPTGIPDAVDPSGEAIPVQVTEAFPGSVLPGSEKFFYDAGAGFVQGTLTSLGGGLFDAIMPALPCGTEIAWYVTAESSNGLAWSSPEGAPTQTYTSFSAQGVVVAASFDMEAPSGWSSGAPGDTATTGIWQRVNPIGTTAQPEDDHTADPAIRCWVTGQGSTGGSVGENDVDGGYTTLLSETLDLSAMSSPTISYWRWFSNDQGGSGGSDIFEIDLSNNGGSTWHSVEVVGPTGPGAIGGWVQHSFAVADVAPPTSQVVMRFIASDLGSGSIVEAGIDDFEVTDVICANCGTANYCTAVANSTGLPSVIASAGTLDVANNDFELQASLLPASQNGIFFYGANQAQQSFGNGNLCVGGTFYRLDVIQSDLSGFASYAVDFNNPPQASGQVLPGSSWNFQFWHRDPAAGGAFYNLSDGLAVTFCP